MQKINKFESKVAVLGLGYIGLPTASFFAIAGFDVTGADVNPEVIERIKNNKIYATEPGLNNIVNSAIRSGKLKLTTDIDSACRNCDIIIITVPTPLKDNKPELIHVENACKTTARNLKKRDLVILESTVPPKTTLNFVLPILEKSGLKAGKDFYLAYCPERVMPGKIVTEFKNNARVIGGINKESAQIAKSLYKKVVKGEMVITDTLTAEVTKLIENTYRDVNIAFANELAIICEHFGCDVKRAIEIANMHPRVNIHSPGCGVGGDCVPVNPILLSLPTIKLGYKPELILKAREINNYMPIYTVDLVKNGLKRIGKDIKNCKIAVLGVTYKRGTNDYRNTPAKIIIQELLELAKLVVVYDPWVKEAFGAKWVEFDKIFDADCIVIVTDHAEFKQINFKKIKPDCLVVDGRNIFNLEKVKKIGLKYVGIGRGNI